MPRTVDYGYSLRAFMGMLITVGPGLAAWFGGDTLDAYPKWLLLVLGIGASSVLLWRHITHRTERDRLAKRPSYPEARMPFQMMLRLVGPPCWCLALGLFGNRLLDTGPPAVHPARFVSYHDPPKSAPVVTVSSWRRPGETESLRFDPYTFDGIGWSTPTGTAVEVLVKGGFFGWEWVVGMRREKK